MFLCHRNTTLLAIVDLQSIGIGIDKYCLLLYIKLFINKITIYMYSTYLSVTFVVCLFPLYWSVTSEAIHSYSLMLGWLQLDPVWMELLYTKLAVFQTYLHSHGSIVQFNLSTDTRAVLNNVSSHNYKNKLCGWSWEKDVMGQRSTYMWTSWVMTLNCHSYGS